MEYDFSKRGNQPSRIVFALSLNRKRLTERIVMGDPEEVRLRLENRE